MRKLRSYDSRSWCWRRCSVSTVTFYFWLREEQREISCLYVSRCTSQHARHTAKVAFTFLRANPLMHSTCSVGGGSEWRGAFTSKKPPAEAAPVGGGLSGNQLHVQTPPSPDWTNWFQFLGKDVSNVLRVSPFLSLPWRPLKLGGKEWNRGEGKQFV